ncbi:MAG TPA: glucose-6-phosphate isomerase, partial [Burkholderiaceae bacterium]
MRCDQSPAWAALSAHHQTHGRSFDLRQAFAAERERFAALSFEAPEVFADLSKNRIDAQALTLLLQLARDCDLEAQRAALFAGAPINHTEGRAVLHTALRAPKGVGAPFNAEVHAALDAMLAFAEGVPAQGFTDVVHIGIGGSDLGPAMVVQALAAYGRP